MKIRRATIFFLYFYRTFASSVEKPIDVRSFLGSRTPYRFVSNRNENKIIFPQCKDTKIWMLVRHGTRLPSPKDIVGMNSTLLYLKEDILLAHDRGRGELTKNQLKDFEKWTSNLEVENAKDLTREGQEEMVLLAERTMKRFPNAVKNKYHNESFFIRYTSTHRTKQSARHFTVGLFDKKNSQQVIYQPTYQKDVLLRFYKHCDKWQKQVKKNPLTYEEQKLFADSPEMFRVRKKVAKKLGVTEISLAQLELMYKICGFETAWHKTRLSTWCHPFDKESGEVMEYYYDLKHYWLDGYGHPLTYQQGCLPIKHMLDTFTNASSPSATFLFAHSGTLLKVLAYLGLHKPEMPLTGSYMQKDRTWRTSYIDSFAANIAFVLYRCKDDDYILTLHQENVIKLPICNTQLCPLSRLQEYFKESVKECDHDVLCSLEEFETSGEL